VGEAEEVERFDLAVWRRPAVTLRAEVDEVRLVRMQREAERKWASPKTTI
jgi:hypothetical protein